MDPDVQTLRTHPLPKRVFCYFAAMGILLEPFQFLVALKMLTSPEYALRWGRGMSKSFMGAHLTVFQALMGRRWAFYTASMDQLAQPKTYFMSNPWVREVLAEMVITKAGTSIPLRTLTNKTARSRRLDGITIDEEAAFEPRQDLYLEALRGTTITSTRPIIWHLSTPVVGTAFELNCNRLKPGLEDWRNYKNCPVPWMNVGEIERLREQYITQGRYWFFELEYLAIWAVPGGKVFVNLVIEPTIPPAAFQTTGADFHGEMGAVIVGAYFTDTAPGDVWITHEHIYHQQQGAFDYSFYRLRYNGLDNRVEGGGFNEGFARYLQQEIGAVIMENTPAERTARLNCALRYRIHICPQVTPFTYEDLRTAIWDPKNGQIYLKDEDHPCHYLDAAMLAIPDAPGIKAWGKTPTRQGPSIRQAERLRDLVLGRRI